MWQITRWGNSKVLERKPFVPTLRGLLSHLTPLLIKDLRESVCAEFLWYRSCTTPRRLAALGDIKQAAGLERPQGGAGGHDHRASRYLCFFGEEARTVESIGVAHERNSGAAGMFALPAVREMAGEG